MCLDGYDRSSAPLLSGASYELNYKRHAIVELRAVREFINENARSPIILLNNHNSGAAAEAACAARLVTLSCNCI